MTSKIRSVIAAFTLAFSVSPAVAEVRTDGSLGAEVTLQGDFTIAPELGQQQGSNLFHSFSQFDVNADESATFTGDVSNIFGRVTAGGASQIDGRVAVDGGAKLWLINPNGLMFGENSQVDASGGFVGLAGDSVRFSDGNQFSALLGSSSTLTAAGPAAYGLANASAPIIFNGELMVGDGADIALVGQGIASTDATISAADGRVTLTAVSGIEVPINANFLDFQLFEQLAGRGGTVRLEQASVVASGESGGAIAISGADVVVLDGSLLQADTEGLGGADGQVLIVAARLLVDGSSIEVDDVRTGADNTDDDGLVSAVVLVADRIELRNSASISSSVLGSGAQGRDIEIEATSLLSLVSSPESFPTEIAADARGAGVGGNIIIAARQVALENSTISADGFGGADDEISLAGNIDIQAQTVVLSGSSQVSSAARGGASIRGSVNVQATDQITLRSSSAGVPTISVAERGSVVGGGDPSDNALSISAPKIVVRGGLISSATTSGFDDDGNADGSGGAGAGGAITIQAANIDAKNFEVSSRSEGEGTAGNVLISASRDLLLRDSSVTAESDQSDGGDVSLQAGRVLLVTDGVVTAKANGAGGNLSISAAPLLILDGQFTANAVEAGGGNIQLSSRRLARSESSGFDASSAFGVDGNVAVTATISEVPLSSERLDSELAQSRQALRDDCGQRARTSGRSATRSSFRVRGRGVTGGCR